MCDPDKDELVMLWKKYLASDMGDSESYIFLKCMENVFRRDPYVLMHYRVHNSERYCITCEQVTCKCSVENCDVI